MNNSKDIATVLADRLVESGLIAANRRAEALGMIARTLAPLTAAAIRAVSVGHDDIYTDAYEYGDRVEEMWGAVDNLSSCVSDDESEMVFEGAAHLIDTGRCGTSAMLDALSITVRRRSPRQIGDLLRLLEIDTENSRGVLVDCLNDIAKAPERPHLGPADIAPLLDARDRHVREAALMVLGRLKPDLDS